jgi:hypothetical protein
LSSLRDHIQAIYNKRGKLTPALVVDEARDEKHPLHDRFEWDDSVAGEQWRRQQAHELIRTVRIVYKPRTEKAAEKTIREWHAVRTEKGHVYEPAEKVVQDEFLGRLVLNDMRREWEALKRRYEDFEEFWQMVRGDEPSVAA